MPRELYRLQPGARRLIVERIAREEGPVDADGEPVWATDMIRYEVRVPGPPDAPPIASGLVHAPERDDKAAARRVLPAIGNQTDVRDELDRETQ